MILDTAQTTTLLKAFELQTQQILYVGKGNTALNCIPIGGDLLEDIILLSEVVDESPRNTLSNLRQSVFDIGAESLAFCHLRINLDSHCLILNLSLLERDKPHSYWKITGSHWRENKRWQPRVRFKPFQSPKATLVREFEQNITSELHDISESAFAISFWNKDYKRDFQSGDLVNVHIVFNEHFSLRVDCQVIDSRFIRQPCCHTRVRLRFLELSDVELSQLSLLIENMGQHLCAA